MEGGENSESSDGVQQVGILGEELAKKKQLAFSQFDELAGYYMRMCRQGGDRAPRPPMQSPLPERLPRTCRTFPCFPCVELRASFAVCLGIRPLIFPGAEGNDKANAAREVSSAALMGKVRLDLMTKNDPYGVYFHRLPCS